MKRSAGVTAAATVAMLGSALMLLTAALAGLSLVLVRHLPQQNGTVPMAAPAQAVSILFYLALGGCGFATALGLLKLRPWSRISMLIFGGFTLVVCIMTGLVLFFMPLPALPNSELSSSDWSSIRMIIVGMFAIPAAIGVWWLVYFNLKSTREQFAIGVLTPAPVQQPIVAAAATPLGAPVARAARPVSITVVACLYLLGALSLPYALMMGQHPTAFFGRLIWGRSAVAVILVTFALTLYAGIGLLKLRPEAPIIGICLTGYGMLNSLLFVLLPGADGRFGDMMGSLEVPSVFPMSTFLWIMKISMLGGAVVSIVILWILFANKSAFQRA
jgi:hypothetical protein